MRVIVTVDLTLDLDLDPDASPEALIDAVMSALYGQMPVDWYLHDDGVEVLPLSIQEEE